MQTVILSVQILTAVIGCLAVVFSIPLFFAFRWPAAAMWGLKVYVYALSYVFVLLGVLSTLVGIITDSIFIGLLGLYTTVVYVVHIISVTRPPYAWTGF